VYINTLQNKKDKSVCTKKERKINMRINSQHLC